MSKVFEYMKQYIGMVLMAVALLFVQAMCDLSLPDYMSDIVDTGVIGGNIQFIVNTGMKMLGLTLLSAACAIIVGFLGARIAAYVSRDMRSDVFKKVQNFSSAEFDKFSTASLITRTTNDITQIQTLLVMMIRMLLYAPIVAVGGAIKALNNSVSMSGSILVAIICIVGFMLFLFAVAFPKMQIVQKLVDRLNLVSRENLEGILVIRSFSSQKFELDRFDKANKDLTSTNLFVNRFIALMMPVMMLIMNITTVAIVWVGAKQVATLNIDIGTMMAFMQYAMLIIMAFLMISVMFILIPRAAVSANRIKDVLNTEESIKDKEKPDHFGNDFTPNIEFRDVGFEYPESDVNVLQNISFTAKKGQTTAIIGATGSGKSTVVNLLMRFYDVTSGNILIDGIDIRDLTRYELREKIGYVPQKSVLFSGDISSNLHYADPNSTDENIDRAASIAQATDFIQSKPERYDYAISEGGSNVSGGQKQRLSIARALVKNAPIYIFDDSFSALDLKTDKKLREALKRETGESIILLVAQRVGSIMNAEQIVVLDNGRIAGIGTHQELLEKCDVYYQIAISQLSKEELNI
jgi:ATP-binding cassette subfamily B protein